jgi:probable HAF family extracellular repeat protein
MERRNFMLPAALLAGLSLACRDESPTATGPSAGPAPAAAAMAAPYTIKNLGTLGGINSRAFAINNMGETVGWSEIRSGQRHAFLYRAGVMHDLGALAGGRSEASAVNDAGTVVGRSTLLSGDLRAVRWQDGMKKNLGTLGGRNSVATGINDDGVIVGYSETKSGATHAFVWKNGVMTDIGTLGGSESRANGINAAGRVVGISTTASGRQHAFAWKDGKFQDLGDHGTRSGEATAINSGRIVGFFGVREDAENSDADSPAFVFSAGVVTIIGTDKTVAQARGVNSDGIVVGFDLDPRDDGFSLDAWLRRTDGMVQYLPELAAGNARAEWINRFGTIAGSSMTAGGAVRAVIWRPQ